MHRALSTFSFRNLNSETSICYSEKMEPKCKFLATYMYYMCLRIVIVHMYMYALHFLITLLSNQKSLWCSGFNLLWTPQQNSVDRYTVITQCDTPVNFDHQGSIKLDAIQTHFKTVSLTSYIRFLVTLAIRGDDWVIPNPKLSRRQWILGLDDWAC